MIDGVIQDLATIMRAIKGYRNAYESELRDMVDDVDTYINQEDAMEEIRTNVCLIRDWGESWKQYALQLEKEYKINVDTQN